MSTEWGTYFYNNNITFDDPASPARLELVELDVDISAGQTVENISGFDRTISYQFYPGIPPKPKPTYFHATSTSAWPQGGNIAISGPNPDPERPGVQLLTLTDPTGQIAYFESGANDGTEGIKGAKGIQGTQGTKGTKETKGRP